MLSALLVAKAHLAGKFGSQVLVEPNSVRKPRHGLLRLNALITREDDKTQRNEQGTPRVHGLAP